MQRFVACFLTILSIILIGWGSSCFGASPAHRAMDDSESAHQALPGRLANKLEYLVDPDVQSFSDAASTAFSSAWQINDKPTLNIGYQPDGAWVRFQVTNSNSKPIQRLLVIDWGFERVEARVLDKSSGQWSFPVITGSNIEPSKRGLASPILGLILTLPPGVADVYLHLEATLPMVVPIRLVDPLAFEVEERNEYLQMGAFFGAMLVMMLYNASLFIFTRDSSYIYYCFYLITAGFYVGSTYDYGPFFLWSGWQWFTARSDVLSISLAFLAAGLFERQFLNIKSEGGWMLRGTSILITYWCFVAIVSMLYPNAIGYMFLEQGGSLSCILAMSIAFVLWRRGNTSAGYFLIAWSCLVTTTFFITLAMAGVIPMNAYIRSAQLVGFTLEFLLLSIALAERINREKASRLQAQEALLAVQEQDNVLLEERVALRTQLLEKANQELLRLSSTDPLTGLSNRRGFEEHFNVAIEHGRQAGVPLAFMMMDIDHFKHINDRYGHSIGDECLALMGKTLKRYSQRDNEFAGRLGGEEFAAVFCDISTAKAKAIAEKIREAIERLILETPGGKTGFTISIGLAVRSPSSEDNLFTFAEAADKALYQAKAQGRNRVSLAPGTDSDPD